jgi:photosystem II stability/assembly factor-like uncharacterized protein
MPADDSLFEKALARQMRGNLAGDGSDAEKHGVCPDAELLAAYHERTLDDSEMVLWKEHIASCGRCQQVLAALEATDDVLVNAEADAEFSAVVDEAGVPLPVVRAKFAHLKAQTVGFGSAARMPMSVPAAPAPLIAGVKRRSRNYWIFSAGAVAAAFLVVLGVTMRTKFLGVPKPANIGVVAEGPELSARSGPPTDAVPGAVQLSPYAPQVRARREGGKVSGLAAPRENLAQKKEPADNSSADAWRVAEKRNEQAAGGGGPAAAPPAAPMDARTTSDSANAPSLRKSVDASGAAVQIETAGASAASASAAPAANMAGRALEDKETQAAGALMQKQAVQSPRASFGVVAARSNLMNPHLIAAPGGNVIWRIGAGGKVEQSMDAGATWKLQNSGVASALNAGSAPSDAVCWIVGAARTILLTVDGGGHWTKLVSPLASDAVGILAVDALHATIWDAAHGNTFVTADGGVTWTRPESKPL